MCSQSRPSDSWERVQRQLVVDLSDLDDAQQVRLREGVEDLLRQVVSGDDADEVVAGWTADAL